MVYKKSWLPKYEHIPEAAWGFPTCMYTMSLEAWRRGLEVTFNLRRSRSLMTGISYTVSDGENIHTFKGSRGSETKREAINVCVNKAHTLQLLRESNIPVPEGQDFKSGTSMKTLLDYSNELGYPLVLKPGTEGRGGGFGVVTNIQSEEEMEAYIKRLKRIAPNSRILIERFFVGEDYRINVFNGKVIGAFHRKALSVLGDGRHSLVELLELKNEERRTSPFLRNSNITMDKAMREYMKERDFTPDYIPQEGEEVTLRRNGEFFGQRDAINVIDTLPEKMLRIAEEATLAIPGLSIGGVDMLINLDSNECVINEINSLPQISNHIFPMQGEAIDIPRIIMDHYFPETKYEKNENDQYYYDYKPILENFRSGAMSKMTLKKTPTREQLKSQLKVIGNNFPNRYFTRMIQRAGSHSINGHVEKVNDNELHFIISAGRIGMNKFKQFIQNPGIRTVSIESVTEDIYHGPITLGFFVKSKS